MMAVWDKKVLWGFVFLLAGAVGQSVNYPAPVCAVTGSTVTLLCTFTPLRSVVQDGREVSTEIFRVVWCQNHQICQGSTPSVFDSSSQNNNPRYKYLGDKKGNCTLQITDVQKKDEATLRFRMEADDSRAHFTGPPGVNVTVSDGTRMQIKSSRGDRELRSGETVTLYCTALCTFHQLEVTWFRDGHALSESGPALHLNPLTAGDSGNYTCGLKMNVSSLSLPYSLKVEEKEKEEEDEDGKLPQTAGVVIGVLLALLALIVVLCFIRRRRAAAADKHQRAVGGEVEQKHPDAIYSNVLPPAEQEGRRRPQEPSQAVEDVSYVSVHFKHNNQARPAVEAEDAVIYSSVASRG
ncbi:myeloid cell surface antigen CD33-like [Micropterus dolomieu]|uniref:myeloid cell surface antigen CD33-like n=1 Tax=Micropterus dolomieu TaxID=147949 RepID=UPI001E8DA523|nr:myeloid cell surface antigen CD33-like [Micropterus dolomieu]